MEFAKLAASTGKQEIDDILSEAIATLETLLPGRIKAYYLHGSFADHSGIETSDIDLFLVSHAAFTLEEREKIQALMDARARLSPFMVEMIAVDEDILLSSGHYRIKAASLFLRGEDLREHMPEQSLAAYVQLYAHFPFLYIGSLLRKSETLTYPLTYPQATGAFFGYDQPLLPPAQLPQQNIKKLVTCVCWIATALLAWQAGKMVPGKRASAAMYRAWIHDEWTSLIEEMYLWGNTRWQYGIPQQPAEQRHLRELCAQTLALENHYVQLYRRYLEAEREQGGARERRAIQQLALICVITR